MMREFHLIETVGGSRFLFHIGMATVEGRFPDHRHDFSELVIILGGTGFHRMEGFGHFTRAGDVHVFNPGAVHGFSDAHALSMCNISYNTELFTLLRDDVRSMPGFRSLFEPGSKASGAARLGSPDPSGRLPPQDLRVAGAMIEEMIAEFHARREGYESLLSGCFLRLVVFLSRQCRLDAAEIPPVILRLAGAVEAIEKGFDRELCVADLARISGLSARHLGRLFKLAYGLAPMEYLQRTRLEYAAFRLLRDADEPVTRIACDAGFDDSNYFARCFRRYYGQSPTAYRREGVAAGGHSGD
jgi:AraC-like DNA-binding protein